MNKEIKSSIGSNIKRRRLELGLTQEELARKLGYKAKSTVNKVELGINDITQSKIQAYADALNTTPAYILGDSTPTQKGYPTVSIPVLGTVAAGTPIEAQQDIIDYEDIPEKWTTHGEYFGLKIKGDSMEPRIHNGSTVIVKALNDAENGDIVIAMIDNEATCKRLHKYADSLVLQSINADYEPIVVTDSNDVKILGKVVRAIEDF